MTDYDAEIGGIARDIEMLAPDALARTLDVERATRYVYRLYQHASLSGSMPGLRRADAAIASLIPRVVRPEDLYLLRANIAFKQHRLDDVERFLAASPHAAACEEGRKIRADLLFQRGRYRDAESAYRDALEHDRAWDSLARYAHYVWKMEDSDRADELYVEAEDELTAKQMRSYAWLELQRGLLDIGHGRFDGASEHYRIAQRAYTGYWMVDEHLAALSAANGNLAAAAILYQSVWERTGKPEMAQALADVWTALGENEAATACRRAAMDEYLASAANGEVCYYHHLTELDEGEPAIAWARKDLDLRSNFATQSALAWALHRAGMHSESAEWMDRALESGVKDGHIYSLAAAIYRAAGRLGKAHRLEHRASAYGVHHDRFHTHVH